jgi:hypothetical protein
LSQGAPLAERAGMKRLLLAAVLCVGCGGPDFSGALKRLDFNSSLSRAYIAWTPAQAVALGSRAGFTVYQEPCLFNCPPPLHEEASVSGPALRDMGSTSAAEVETVLEGSATVSWTGDLSDHFSVEVRAPVSLALTDPLLFDRPAIAQFIGFNGATWPDVGNELVMGPGGMLYFETLVLDDAGQSLGFDSSQLSASAGDAGWLAFPDTSLIDVHAPDAGSTVLTLGFGDAGCTARLIARVGGLDEAGGLSVVSQPALGAITVFKASAVTLDGGSFFEPLLEWIPDPGFTEVDVQARFGLRPRRDVKVYSFFSADAGTYDAGVTVRWAGYEANASTVITVNPDPPPPPPPPPAMMAPGCGCSSAGSPLLLAALGLRRRRR